MGNLKDRWRSLRLPDAERPLFRYLLALTLGLLLLTATSATLMVVRSAKAEDRVFHAFQVRQIASELFGDLQDSEIGQRGYLLTDNPAFLEPYNRAQPGIKDRMATLFSMTSDNPLQQQRLRELAALVDKRLELLKSNMDLARQGQRAAAIDVVKEGNGKKVMDAIRVKVADFMAAELSLLEERDDDADMIRKWLLALVLGSVAAAIGIGVLVLQSTHHYVERLRERTEALEAETKRREESEATVRQVQKIEAVGQLSGGIAHDFNNLLTIIMGNLDTMARRIEQAKSDAERIQLSEVLKRPIELAMRGAQSAAKLTQQLLAFSRRQALDPSPTDVNKLVSGMSELLQRTLTEAIQIETVLAGGLWPALVDANQLENAVINLAVNARDAMPEGGKLTIETANAYLDEAYAARFGDVAAGQYVVLGVTDTGTGIAPDVLPRIFEPFFTTKEVGKGSGLGLAMIHGFVKQSEGHIRIYSEPNLGTTVKIYLPRVVGSGKGAVPQGRAVSFQAAARATDGETILLVEDNEGVREYARDVLQALGYRVLEASDSASAFAHVDAGQRIDLLFTDVVLPGGESGRAIADRLREKHAHIPILFTTGYTRNAIVHHGRLDANVQLLNKPYTQEELARKVRQVLDGETTTGKPAVRAKS